MLSIRRAEDKDPKLRARHNGVGRKHSSQDDTLQEKKYTMHSNKHKCGALARLSQI